MSKEYLEEVVSEWQVSSRAFCASPLTGEMCFVVHRKQLRDKYLENHTAMFPVP